ncbi:MAG TPA: hypothetical protein VEO95_13680, partial [Chthoniobacteraceae bacterium]|nr:hypothetical protein [Chthoniobacteraceae bacterium]
AALHSNSAPALQRRALRMLDQMPNSPLNGTDVVPLLDAPDPALARAAAEVIAPHQDWITSAADHIGGWFKDAAVPAESLDLLETIAKPWINEKPVRELISPLLASADIAQQRAAWRILGAAAAGAPDGGWAAPLESALANAAPGDQPLVIEAIARFRTPELSAALTKFSDDEKRPLGLRMKALRAALKPGSALPPDSFAMLKRVLGDPSSASARLEAARILATAKLAKEQLLDLAQCVGVVGPLELREMLKAFRQSKDTEVLSAFANALKNAAALGALSESEIRSAMSAFPPEIFEIVAPALRDLAAEDVARKRKLETLPALVAAKGRAAEGRKIFESGRGVCSTCHRIGDVGNFVGPNLSEIGKIRGERDILESILFPSATIAHDFEAYNIETASGQTIMGVIRRNLPDSVVIADPSGQEQTLPRAQITAVQMLPTSLMPAGLDRTISEQDLLDLVAYLRSRK